MQKYIRFIDGFRRFHKLRMEPEEAVHLAHKVLKERVEPREENFSYAGKRAAQCLNGKKPCIAA